MVYDPWNRIYRGIAAANEAIAGAALVDAPEPKKTQLLLKLIL